MGTKVKKRLPRYRRLTREKPALILQERDIEIIDAVYNYRLLSSEQIKALFRGSDRGILLRLQKLFHNGYLDRITGPVSAPIVYGLGDQGVDLLSEIYGLERGHIKRRKGNRGAREYCLAHTLQIANFIATLSLALKDRSETQIITWVPEREIKDEVVISESYYKKVSVPLIPDGFFTIEDQGELISFFLEIDRPLIPIQRFLNKIKAYGQYWREGQYKKKLDIDNFRVLIIAKNQERKEYLRTMTKSSDWRRTGSEMFWFTREKSYDLSDPESILEPIWQTSRNNRWHHLLE
jgi:hypothetical protein